EGRRTRLRSSARSTARICVIDAANKKEAAAVDELFHQNGRQTRALQLPRKIPPETECHRLPKREKSRAKQSTATSPSRRSRCTHRSQGVTPSQLSNLLSTVVLAVAP